MTDNTFKTLTMNELAAESIARNETNDCSVRALAVVTGEDYEAAHSALQAEGRRHRKGVNMLQIVRAAKRLGYTMVRGNRRDYVCKTVRTAERDRRLQRGAFMLEVRRHVAGMKDGNIVDWSDGRLNRIQRVWEITKDAAVAPAAPSQPIPTFAWSATPAQGELF